MTQLYNLTHKKPVIFTKTYKKEPSSEDKSVEEVEEIYARKVQRKKINKIFRRFDKKFTKKYIKSLMKRNNFETRVVVGILYD